VFIEGCHIHVYSYIHVYIQIHLFDMSGRNGQETELS
jgi:hypothetical protein